MHIETDSLHLLDNFKYTFDLLFFFFSKLEWGMWEEKKKKQINKEFLVSRWAAFVVEMRNGLCDGTAKIYTWDDMEAVGSFERKLN